ncbi:hypothetical protein BGZ47_008470 [Haplosporangium gracile]|nr:hypothetical protein BGZ47_008470 [Haplosporangium gracile]
MTRSTTLFSLIILLLLATILPIFNHHIHVLAAPVPIPATVSATDTITDKPALAVEHPCPSTIEKRQLLGGLLGGLPSFKNEGGNAI